MDRLKKILRQALADQAQRISLTEGSTPEWTSTTGEVRPVQSEAPFDAAALAHLFQFLFPADKAALATKQLVKGALNVPGVGKISLIAQPATPVSLRLYLPPSGQSLHDADWARLNNKTVVQDGSLPPPPMATPRPAQPQPQQPIGGGAFIPAFLTGAPDLSAPAPSQPISQRSAAPSQPAPLPVGGFVPPGLDGLGPTSPPSSTAPAESAPHPSPMPVLQAPPMSPMYSPPQAPAPHFQAPQPFPDPMPSFSQPIVFNSPSGHVAPSGPVAINFGSDGDSVDSSTGQNAIDPILTDMIKRKASDLHMTSGEPYCFRVDGEIARISKEPVDDMRMEQYILPIMPKRNQEEFVKTNDTDFAYEIQGVGRFRVNVFRDKNGVGSVMRHIPSKILTAEQLNLPAAITKFCNLTKGLVLVTGPTGSGKSTTLAAMIDLINKTRADHILTIEDPIEFVHPQQKCLVNQREVHKHTGSFSRALKAALREDPDIILIGEMRDLETISIAIETAETGHLVFGTLHTTTAVSTIDRIIDQFPSDQQGQIRMMLASSLRGVVAQTLLKKKGGGRVAAQEILVPSDAVSAMIREGKNHMIGNHMQTQKGDGNVLLNEALLKLVREGVVDPDDAMKKAVDKTSLADAYKRMNVKWSGAGGAPVAPGKAS